MAGACAPDGWRDVRVTRWLSLDEIEQSYGRAAAREVEGYEPEELDFGEQDEGRGKFGDAYLGPFEREDGSGRQRPCVRVVDQQAFRWELAQVLLYPDGRIQHGGMVFDRLAIPRNRSRFRPGDDPAASRPGELQAVTGAALLIRRALFEELGGFDAAYRNSFEDVDLCLRARERVQGPLLPGENSK